MRYFLGLTETAGMFAGVARGLRQLGRRADLVLSTQHPYAYSESDNVFTALFFAIDKARALNRALFFSLLPLKAALVVATFIYALFRYDVFIFSGFNSFFYFYELTLLRMLGKKTVVMFLGSDSRPPYLNGIYLDTGSGAFDVDTEHRRLQRMKRKIRRIECAATLVIGHTATAQLMEKTFVPGLQIGIPVDVQRIVQIANDAESRKATRAQVDGLVRIVHAPSRPQSKGTDTFRRVVRELNEDFAGHLRLELVELQNVSNQKVIREIAACDFVVNELYSDTFMSGLDAEAAALGKPSLKFGYYTDGIRCDNPGAPMPEYLLYFPPNDVKSIVRQFALDPDLRRRTGDCVRHFVEQVWNARGVAERLEAALQDVAAARRADPAQLTYVMGFGLPIEMWCKNISAYVSRVGWEGLGLRKHLLDAIRHTLYADR